MTERIRCKKEDCNNTILPETAKRTGGFCMPCVQKKEREERQKYIEKNRKDIDPFLGVNDPVEIIRLHHVKRPNDPLIRYASFKGNLEEIYSKLTEFDEARLIDMSIKEAEKGNLEYIKYICLELAAFRSSNLFKLHKFMLLNKLYYPGIIFKDANSEIIKELIKRVDDDTENRNHILLALAWSANKDVITTFSSWFNELPAWSNRFHIPPYDYSKEAGWELSPLKKVRKLYFDRCYPLLPAKNSSSHACLRSCTYSENKCKWCGRNLTNLLELDLSDKSFDFIGFTGKKFKISTCEVCACYSEALFMDFDSNGNTAWSAFNAKPDYLPDDSNEWGRLPENCFTLSLKTRPAFYASNEFLPTSFSQIGGMPTWIQNFAYPKCPSCQKTMTFVAQISNEEIEQYSEGTYYMYVCCECNISATNYQQT